jgi:hypothetical protein
MARESYDELILALGDLAREHLAESRQAPPAMEHVFAAEDAVLRLRDEVAAREERLNREDAEFQEFLAQQAVEKDERMEVIKTWRSAVAGVEARSRDLKKKLSSLKAAYRYQRKSLKLAEDKHKDLEMREGHDARKIHLSKENLKKGRLHLMREQRHVEELEWELNQVLTPRPGQVGAPGILAHKRILELEDELEERTATHEDAMRELDQAIAAEEERLHAAEGALDAAVFELGEACYGLRLAHPRLSPLYGRLDKAG